MRTRSRGKECARFPVAEFHLGIGSPALRRATFGSAVLADVTELCAGRGILCTAQEARSAAELWERLPRQGILESMQENLAYVKVNSDFFASKDLVLGNWRFGLCLKILAFGNRNARSCCKKLPRGRCPRRLGSAELRQNSRSGAPRSQPEGELPKIGSHARPEIRNGASEPSRGGRSAFRGRNFTPRPRLRVYGISLRGAKPARRISPKETLPSGVSSA